MAETTPEETPDPAPAAPKPDTRAERRAARLARQIGAFARAHGGSTEANVAYIGERGARIVLVGADGVWGDLVAPSHGIAQAAVVRAGVPVREELDGELGGRMRSGRYEWARMAGIQIGGRANT
ncbi:hypothetical protein ACFO3J_03100 [Streptomyces polygonati]|uniref:Uncharacterized protein n=1 Tax=Streptomyces polygonati TaxID=1617087 RepID=A0ABV8HG44_9ACTN